MHRRYHLALAFLCLLVAGCATPRAAGDPSPTLPTKTVRSGEHHHRPPPARAKRRAVAPLPTTTTTRPHATPPPTTAEPPTTAASLVVPDPPPVSDGTSTTLQCIKDHESGNYDEQSHPWDGSGAYQWIPSSWQEWSARAGLGGYTYAYEAPPAVQDAVTSYALTHGGAGNWSSRYGNDPCTE